MPTPTPFTPISLWHLRCPEPVASMPGDLLDKMLSQEVVLPGETPETSGLAPPTSTRLDDR